MATDVVLSAELGTFTVSIEGDRLRVVETGEEFSVSEIPPDRFSVAGEAGKWTMAAARLGESVWIGVDGHTLEFKIGGTPAQAPGAHRDRDALTPPMPATVVRIHAHTGQRVDTGDTLIVLEAMKMELPIRAPRAGTVRAVHCAEGQLVQPGDALIDLE
jgi:3-methylcrotonyl-CoA carboxylase alpha subunit